jgi:hypothetical protein
MLRLKKNALSLCLFGLALPIIGSVISILFLKNWRFDNYSIHGIIEITGTIIAVVIFLFFSFSHKLQKHFAKKEILCISAAISGMGILDGFHAISPPGNNFVWLHSIATFIGGILFAAILIPYKNTILRSEFPLAVLMGSIILGIMSFSFPEHIPKMVVQGEFTILARALNILGGIGFIAASFYFYKKYTKNNKVNYYLLAAHCLLFGAAGILFEMSSLWDAAWWWWHMLRLFAYVVLIFFFVETITKQIKSYSFSLPYIYIEKLLATLLIFISALVILGWYTENKGFIQISPDFAPMQYNTALCFLISGIGIIALKTNQETIRIAGAIFVFTLGLVTLSQYIFNVNFGIDELFMDAYINTKVSHPGRMAPNTALCFAITGALMLYYKNKLALISMNSSLIALSGLALIGYLVGTEEMYGFGSLTRMAIHTATGFLIIATTFYLITKKDRKTKFDIWKVSPIICSTVLSLATLFAWHSSKEFTITANKSYFNKLVQDKINVIEGRFELYEHALLGGKGLFNASKTVERVEWSKYTKAVNPTKKPARNKWHWLY